MIKRRNGLLAFMLAIATGCTALACVLFGGSVTARADSLQKNTTDLFSSYTYNKKENGVDVEKELTFTPSTVLYDSVKGVKVTGEDGYSEDTRGNIHWYYTVNGTFYGDSSIEYVFATTRWELNEATSFVYTDVNGNRLLSVLIVPKEYGSVENLYGGVYAEKDRTDAGFGVHTLTVDGTKTEVQVSTAFENMAANREAFTNLGNGFLPVAAVKNAIKIDFRETGLSVLMLGADGKMVEVVAFDYDEYPQMKDMEKNGYKLRISDGDDYGVDQRRAWSLLENWGSAFPSVISVNGLALTEEKVSVSETFADILYEEGETFDGTNAVIALSEGKSLGSFSYASFLGITTADYGELRFPEVYQSGKIKYPEGEKYSKKACGEYSVSVPYGNIEKNYKLVIGRDYSEILDLGNEGSITLTPASRVNAYTGALLQTDTRHWLYGIKGNFSDNSRIEYSFTTQSIEATSFIYYGADGKRVFTVFLVPSATNRSAGSYYGGLYLESEYKNVTTSSYTYANSEYAQTYGETIDVSLYDIHTVTKAGEKKTAQFIKNTNDPTFIAGVADRGNRKALENAVGGDGFLPAYDGKFAISLLFGEDALSVQMDDKNGNSVEVVSLPYKTYPEVESMRTGYTLKIGSGAGEERDYALMQNEKGNIPSLLSINGENLDGVYPEITYTDWEITHKHETIEGTKNVIEINRTDDLGAFYVTASYTFGGILLDRVVEVPIYADETFGEKTAGEYEYTFVYGGEKNGIAKQYTIRVIDPVPQLSLRKDLNGYETIFKDKNQMLKASPDDVIAEDKLDGVLSNVTIEVKAPNRTEFVAYDTFTLGEYGLYTIRYSATNSCGLVGSVERVVRYMPSQLEIELSGELPSVAYTGKKVVLPTANVAATVSVIFEGKTIEIVDSGFTPYEVGDYEITYTYTDDYEVTAVLQAKIVVLSDVTSPVITVREVSGNYKVGDKLIAPTASAIDEADGEVQVTTAIYFEEKQVGDSEVTTEKAGIYTIVYTAMDSSGNPARKDVQVFVYSPSADAFSDKETKSGCGSVIGGSVSELLILASVLTGTGALILKRKKN